MNTNRVKTNLIILYLAVFLSMGLLPPEMTAAEDPGILDVVREDFEGNEAVDTKEAEKEDKEETIYDIRQRIERARKDRFELLRLLAYIYTTTEQHDEAIEMYEKALAVEPDSRDMLEALLELYRKQERWADMAPIYANFLDKYKGENTDYYKELINLYFKIEETDRAFETVQRFVNEHGEDESTYIYAQRIYLDHNRKQEALDILKSGLTELPDSYYLNKRIAFAYVDLEDYMKALDHFEIVKNISTSSSDKEDINTAMMALYEKADIIQEIIARKNTELDDVEKNLAELYQKQGAMKEKAEKWDEAIEAYRKLVVLAPRTRKGKMAANKIKELEGKMEDN